MEEFSAISMEDIFRQNSPLAKDITELKEQIEDAKRVIHSIDYEKDEDEYFVRKVDEFLEVFYKGNSYKGTKLKQYKSQTRQSILYSLYSILAHKMEVMSKKNDELDDFLKGV
jgi:hypothetical protein